MRGRAAILQCLPQFEHKHADTPEGCQSRIFAGVSTGWNPYLPNTSEYTEFLSGYEAAYSEVEEANIQLDAVWGC